MQAHLARWKEAGVPDDADVTRCEVGLTTKGTLKAVTAALYKDTLSAGLVFATWSRRRSIRVCPRGANRKVSQKTKNNQWPICERYAAVMAVPAKREPALRLPRLNLHDPVTNYRDRTLAACNAAQRRLVGWAEFRDFAFSLWRESVVNRAEELTQRAASTAVLGFGYDPGAGTEPSAPDLLGEGLCNVHAALLEAGRLVEAGDLVDAVKRLHQAPTDKAILDKTTELLVELLTSVLDRHEENYLLNVEDEQRLNQEAYGARLRSRLDERHSGEALTAASSGFVCDGYTHHKRGPAARATRQRRSARRSGPAGPIDNGEV
jgi:hypothetical protein